MNRHLILKGTFPFCYHGAFFGMNLQHVRIRWLLMDVNEHKPVASRPSFFFLFFFSVFHIDTEIMIVNFHLLRKLPQWVYNPTLRHFHPSAASQYSPWHWPHLAAHLNMCRQVFLGAKSLGTGRAGVPSLFGVHRGQVPMQVCAVPKVFQTVRTLH